MNDHSEMFEGGCTCRHVRYRMTSRPLFIHCCHCHRCQIETGSAFAINALIEADRVELISGQVEKVTVPTDSGKGQDICSCPKCGIAVWSNFGGAGNAVHFLKVGTLDQAVHFAPDVHIFTDSMQPWVELPQDTPQFSKFYSYADLWPVENYQRLLATRRK